MVDTALRAAPSELGVVDGIGAQVEQRAWPRLGPRAAWALACVAVDGTIHANDPEAAHLIELLGLDTPAATEFRQLWIDIIALAARHRPELHQ